MVRADGQRSTTARFARKTAAGSIHLVAYWEGGSVDRRARSTGEVVIGRDPDADLCVPHPSVSRHHARLRFLPVPTIEDLGTVNGTRVGGRLLPKGERAPVIPGAAVEVGDALLVVHGTASADEIGATATTSMRRVHELIERFAPGSIPITFVGETGVGKDALVQELHSASTRSNAPLVHLSCVALSEDRLELELCGSRDGPDGPQRGLLEAAEGGTLFLDDVGELPKPSQGKLLWALQSKRGCEAKASANRKHDVRFVGATQRDLDRMVKEGQFRADLFHRICGVVVKVPPLRERRDEIVKLAEDFAGKIAGTLGQEPPKLGASFVHALQRYHWPGNLRELKYAVECAILLARGETLEAVHLPHSVLSSPEEGAGGQNQSLSSQLNAVERERIADALEKCGGNQSRAARLLGMPRRTLVERIATYGLPRPRAQNK